MEMNMHASITPNRELILTRSQTLNMYVLEMMSISFQVVKIHHGSRTRASQGRMRRLAVEPRLLKYSKLDQASATQKGWTAMRVPMNR